MAMMNGFLNIKSFTCRNSVTSIMQSDHIIKQFSIIIIFIVITGCNRPVAELFPDSEELRPVKIYVVSHGWHVGIVLPNNEMFESCVPSNYHGLQFNYNEFGWGDRDYYMSENPGLWISFKAAVWPTSSVVHAASFDREVGNQFSGSEIVEILLSEKGFEALCARLVADMEKDRDGQLIMLESGWYANSHFYKSDRRYILPRTSNKWVARLLREAGAPVTPFYALTSGNVIYQSRQIGNLIGE
jgi:uncharacterized protein (TIGR02117 family)